jgi:hypothetical protein
VLRFLRAYGDERKAARQRERVFAATQTELARQQAEEAWSRETDYFAKN